MNAHPVSQEHLLATVHRTLTEALGHEPEVELTPELALTGLGLDSLGQLELITLLENEFAVFAPAGATDHVQTLGQLLDVLRALIDGTPLPTITLPASDVDAGDEDAPAGDLRADR
jgi:acyl carrier protein